MGGWVSFSYRNERIDRKLICYSKVKHKTWVVSNEAIIVANGKMLGGSGKDDGFQRSDS